jgi:hypothetical protein
VVVVVAEVVVVVVLVSLSAAELVDASGFVSEAARTLASRVDVIVVEETGTAASC